MYELVLLVHLHFEIKRITHRFDAKRVPAVAIFGPVDETDIAYFQFFRFTPTMYWIRTNILLLSFNPT